MENTINNENGISKWNFEQIKLEKKGFLGESIPGTPLSISLEITSKFNYDVGKKEWFKTTTCVYIADDCKSDTTETHQEKIENPIDLIKKLETYDLPNLKNNYFTNLGPHMFFRWELTYNYHFKIVGTYDQEIKEFKEISDLLGFGELVKEAGKKFEKYTKRH